jgi:hypothetical protein
VQHAEKARRATGSRQEDIMHTCTIHTQQWPACHQTATSGGQIKDVACGGLSGAANGGAASDRIAVSSASGGGATCGGAEGVQLPHGHTSGQLVQQGSWRKGKKAYRTTREARRWLHQGRCCVLPVGAALEGGAGPAKASRHRQLHPSTHPSGRPSVHPFVHSSMYVHIVHIGYVSENNITWAACIRGREGRYIRVIIGC